MRAACFVRAAELIAGADGLLITAGAGMGVDSGLPDFRGEQGFWKAYPALGRARMQFEEIASPQAFRDVPTLAWGFYGHRLNLYRDTHPHDGFRILQDIATRLPHGAFVFTSNVDGQFQKAGFDEERIVECHGSIHHLQCLDGCEEHIWSASGFRPQINEGECRILSRMPTCPFCRKPARPNILMFGDGDWIATRKYDQQWRLRLWRESLKRPVVIEIGAGAAIPFVRAFGEEQRCPLIRINSTEPSVSEIGVSLAVGGLMGLQGIWQALDNQGFWR